MALELGRSYPVAVRLKPIDVVLEKVIVEGNVCTDIGRDGVQRCTVVVVKPLTQKYYLSPKTQERRQLSLFSR